MNKWSALRRFSSFRCEHRSSPFTELLEMVRVKRWEDKDGLTRWGTQPEIVCSECMCEARATPRSVARRMQCEERTARHA